MGIAREYIVLFEPEDEGWTASVPDLPGCFSDGLTFEDATSSIQEAIRLWLESAKASGWTIPEPKARAQKFAV